MQKWKCAFSAVLLVASFTHAQTGAATAIDRTQYVRDIFAYLPQLLPLLISGMNVKEEVNPRQADIDFLNAALRVLKDHKPQLIFVDDSEQFIINSGEKPRLMRTPEDGSAPIFINSARLNSKDFSLNLVQLIKLLLHELGHKTKLGTVQSRDLIAQNIENELKSALVVSESDPGSANNLKIEALSLDPAGIQSAVESNPYVIQPTFLIFAERNGQIVNLTADLKNHVQDHSIIGRNIGTEITTVITGIAEVFTAKINEALNPFMTAMSHMFTTPGEKPPESPFGKIPKGIQSMSLIGIQHISQSHDEIIFELSQMYSRTHRKTLGFNISGLPFSTEGESFPMQLRITNLFSENRRIQLQASADVNYDKTAKVGRIIRENGEIKSIEVSFDNKVFPFGADLVLQYPGGSIRLPASHRELAAGEKYKVRYDFNKDEFRQTAFADRIVIDNEEILFLDRQIEIQENVTAPSLITDEEILKDSIGVWGKRGVEDEFKTTFSHIKPAMLFYLSGPQNNHFVINPMNVWIEFQIREDIEVAQAELFWSMSQYIFDTGESTESIITINEQQDDGRTIKQRYAASGSIVAQKNPREAILFDESSLKVKTSETPGFKTVMMKAIFPLKHIRALEKPSEAHTIPMVTPLGIRVVTKDRRSYTHTFPGEHTAEFLKAQMSMDCASILTGEGKP